MTKQITNKKDFSKYRYTVDYIEDLKVIRKLDKILKQSGQRGTVKQICNILKTNNNIFKLNSKFYFGIGWKKVNEVC